MELFFIFITMSYVATWEFTFEDKTLMKSDEGREGGGNLDIVTAVAV